MNIEKVDVTIATKNNEEIIEKCITAIKDNIPYNNIILLDDSTDETPRIAGELGAIVHHAPVLLGEKRYLQAKYSETEWIASIDSDIFVFPNWWQSMSKNIDDNVGIISSCVVGSIKELIPAYDHFTKWKALKSYNKTKKSATIGNNLIRRDLILSCDELKKVHVAEDTLLVDHIIGKGYECAINKVITGFHYHNDPIGHIKMSYRRMGKEYIHRGFNIRNLASIFTLPFFMTYDWISFNFYTKNFNFGLLIFLFSLYFEVIKGLVKGK